MNTHTHTKLWGFCIAIDSICACCGFHRSNKNTCKQATEPGVEYSRNVQDAIMSFYSNTINQSVISAPFAAKHVLIVLKYVLSNVMCLRF